MAKPIRKTSMTVTPSWKISSCVVWDSALIVDLE